MRTHVAVAVAVAPSVESGDSHLPCGPLAIFFSDYLILFFYSTTHYRRCQSALKSSTRSSRALQYDRLRDSTLEFRRVDSARLALFCG